MEDVKLQIGTEIKIDPLILGDFNTLGKATAILEIERQKENIEYYEYLLTRSRLHNDLWGLVYKRYPELRKYKCELLNGKIKIHGEV
jgi:hypothetical protein